jgi:outer membrane protein TolC
MKMKMRLVFGCGMAMIMLAFGRLALAQDAGAVLNLSLSDAISMALEASEDLKLQDNTVKRKQSEHKEEKGARYPLILGSVGWSNNFEYPVMSASSGMQDYHLDTGVTISQTLFTFGRIANAVEAAQKALEASRFDQDGVRQNIIYNAKIAFYHTHLAKRTLEVAEESYQNALRNKEILEGRSAGGRVSKYDNIKISADIASRKPVVNNARATFLSAMETLKVVVGADTKDSIILVEDFPSEYPDFDRENLALSLRQNQPVIRSLEQTVEEKAATIQSKKAMLFPEVSAFATWNHKGDGNNYYVGRDNLDDYGVAGLKVSVPIWVGGIDREKLYQARIDKNDAELRYQKGMKDYLLMLDKVLAEYQEYQKMLDANEEALRLAKESFQYSQELLGSGQVSVTDLNDAELQLTNAKLSREMTVFHLNATLAEIERLTLLENVYE